MMPAEELAVVRARLERMVDLAEITKRDTLLLRVAREALGVLNRHHQMLAGDCEACGPDVDWPCPEVAAALRAWQP